jgi:dolichyl-phosphate-mannose-protein mannosyltransferase
LSADLAGLHQIRSLAWNHHIMLRTRIPSHIAVPAVVLAIAAGLRLWGFTTPQALYWDEQYYVFDAEVYIGGGIGQPIEGAPEVKIADEGTWVHPPLGKWIIALLGVGPLGLRSIGWRLPSVLFGIAGVALLYFLALQLWRSVWWAGFASLLLALDGLHIVQSRMAMLDIFLTTFVTAGVFLLVLDHRRAASHTRDGTGSTSRVERVFGSWYLLGAGASLGAAVATKWSGAFALLFALVLCCAWIVRDGGEDDRPLAVRLGTVAASLLVVPAVVYLLSYGAFFYQHGFAVRDFITLQLRMLHYQQGHLKIQPENSEPWTWPLLLHPIQYTEMVRAGADTMIVALGNPVLWWGFLAVLPAAAIAVVRRRTWQDAVTFGGYAAMFLTWFLIGRSQFLFYMLPAVPFMCLGVAATLRRLSDHRARIAGSMFAGSATIATVLYAPIWLGTPVIHGWVRPLELLPDWHF